MKKTGATPIRTPDEARDAIRGSSGLVDSVRFAYALWPAAEDEARTTMKALSLDYRRGAVARGAIVKTNEDASSEVRTFVRTDWGLLRDRTDELKGRGRFAEEELAALVDAIGKAAAAGRPMTRTGQAGVYQRRSALAEALKTAGRDRLERMVQHLLDNGRLVIALASGTTTKWLDVPDGKFAQGQGAFRPGADSAPEPEVEVAA